MQAWASELAALKRLAETKKNVDSPHSTAELRKRAGRKKDMLPREGSNFQPLDLLSDNSRTR